MDKAPGYTCAFVAVSLIQLVILFLLLCSVAVVGNDLSAQAVRVSVPIDTKDPAYRERALYSIELLKLVLGKTRVPYQLEMVDLSKVPSSRNVKLLRNGVYTVAPFHTSYEREHILRPIRYPIYRGLGGWRIFFVNESDTRFDSVSSVTDLKVFKVGQGHDWPDTEVLALNKFLMLTAYNRDALFQHLKQQRIDYFPRGINEIWDEQLLTEAQGLKIEPGLVLRYPTATYFFVDPTNTRLAQLLEKGFEIAIEDGSFQQLFMFHLGETIHKAELAKRKVLEIPNPVLSPQTPLKRTELWFSQNELP